MVATPDNLALIKEATEVEEPDLGGTLRMEGQKLNSLNQAEGSSLFLKMSEKISDSAEQQAGREDLGTCFIIGPLKEGCEMDGKGGV